MRYEVYVPRPGYSVRPPDQHPRAAAGRQDEDTVRIDRVPRSAGPVVRREFPLVTAAPPDRAGARPGAASGTASGGLRRVAEASLLVAGALLAALLVKIFLLQAFSIPSGSMVPALQVGDRVLVEKVSYRFREPARGEVVVFRRPGPDGDGGAVRAVRSFLGGLGVLRPPEEVELIKRVVGLPGETVEVVAGVVRVDGRPLREEALVPDRRSFPAVTVPASTYYVLGDNRPSSDDSRYTLGPVPAEAVVGRAFMILWPPGNASVSLRSHYAGTHPTDDHSRDRRPSGRLDLRPPDHALEAPPP